jgi:hypothetical protein
MNTGALAATAASIKFVRNSCRLQAQSRALFAASVGTFMTVLLVTPANAQVINSISPISDTFGQTITITGSGFGTMAPYTGNSSDIIFADCNGDWSAGYSGPSLSDVCGIAGPTGDAYGLIVDTWNNSQIVLGGIDDNGYDDDFGSLQAGDPLEVFVFNAQTGAGPAEITANVVPEPSSVVLLGSGLLGLAVLRRRRQSRRSAIATPRAGCGLPALS